MSWFNLGISKDELEKQEREFERKYGKVKIVNERKEFDSLPTIDEEIQLNEDISDTNIDQIVDYSDNDND